MKRLDKIIYEKNLAKSRTSAAELISTGKVTVNGETCTKPSQLVSETTIIELCGEMPESLKYISRAGLKLEHALNSFEVDLQGKICLDVGASTGGFTDCMLKHSAFKVYAVDVGTNQLDDSLRHDKRVISLEQCDIRTVTTEIPEKVDFVAVDVSFISQKLILPELKRFISPKATLITLIKPQFELGKKHTGVITDKKTRGEVVDKVSNFAKDCGFSVKGLIESPICGKSGNHEFLMWLEV
ncbi:MAG: TlyA family RNA methyltransferase [Oscillospiraceae bacterium]|nr:TlyA family RNA methyltransferase [Oscillospiraceae bacterium]